MDVEGIKGKICPKRCAKMCTFEMVEPKNIYINKSLEMNESKVVVVVVVVAAVVAAAADDLLFQKRNQTHHITKRHNPPPIPPTIILLLERCFPAWTLMENAVSRKPWGCSVTFPRCSLLRGSGYGR